jgi:hypothetical protein
MQLDKELELTVGFKDEASDHCASIAANMGINPN